MILCPSDARLPASFARHSPTFLALEGDSVLIVKEEINICCWIASLQGLIVGFRELIDVADP